MGQACTTAVEVPNEADIEQKVTEKLQRQHTKTLERVRTQAKRETLKLTKEAAELQKRLAEAVGANYTPKTGIYKSQANDVEMDEYKDMSLTDFVFQNFGEFSDHIAVVDPSSTRAYKYSKLQKLVGHVSTGLFKRGFRKGDVFAIMAPNVREFPIIFYAVISLGGIVTTLNPSYKKDTVVHQLKDTKAKYMAVTTGTLDTALSAIEETKSIKELFVFGSDSFLIPKDLETNVTPFRDVKGDKGDKVPDKVEINPETDVCVIPYSSGTSGLPKGVMLTHRNVIANYLQAEAALNIQGDDQVLGLLPMFHMYGMFMFLVASLRVGATIVTMKKQFNLTELLDAIQEHKVTRAHLVPPIMLAFAKAPIIDKYDLSSLREIMSAAAPLSSEMAQLTAKRLNVDVRQGYGMTELSPVATMGVLKSTKYGSVGRLLPNTEAKVVDADGKALGPNEKGELWIRGPQVMKGYLNNQSATKETTDSKGFVHTGDVAFCDDEGDFWIVDRLKEIIKYKGFQVAPAELEGVLEEHDKIAAAGVIGVVDTENGAGEVPAAFVQLAKDAEMTAEEVMHYVAEKVAGYKKVRIVHFVKEVPKSASGKILRRELAELARKAQKAKDEVESKEKEEEKPATKKEEPKKEEPKKKEAKKEEPKKEEVTPASAPDETEEPAAKEDKKEEEEKPAAEPEKAAEEEEPKKEEAAKKEEATPTDDAVEETKSTEDPKPAAEADKEETPAAAAASSSDNAAADKAAPEPEPAVSNGGGNSGSSGADSSE